MEIEGGDFSSLNIWKKAVDEEISAHVKNNTCILLQKRLIGEQIKYLRHAFIPH